MADKDNKFDSHDAPTIMEMSPVFDAQPPKRPASGGSAPEEGAFQGAISLLQQAFEMYKGHFALFVITAAVAMGPVYLVQNAIRAFIAAPAAVVGTGLEAHTARLEALQKQLESASTPEERARIEQEMFQTSVSAFTGAGVATGGALAAMLAGFGLLLLTIPLTVLATFLAQAAIVVVVSDRARGGSITWQRAWQVVGQRVGPLILTSLLSSLIVLGGTLLCVLPGLVAGFFLALAMPIVLLERRSGMDALKRSMTLVQSDWVRVLLVGIAFIVLSAVAAAVGSILIPSRFVFLHGFIGDLVSIVVAPIPIIALVLLYESIVRSREGERVVASQRADLLA